MVCSIRIYVCLPTPWLPCTISFKSKARFVNYEIGNDIYTLTCKWLYGCVGCFLPGIVYEALGKSNDFLLRPGNWRVCEIEMHPYRIVAQLPVFWKFGEHSNIFILLRGKASNPEQISQSQCIIGAKDELCIALIYSATMSNIVDDVSCFVSSRICARAKFEHLLSLCPK